MALRGLLCLILSWLVAVQAYIPASATNDTNAAIKGGLNVTDVSKLHLQWFNNGSTSETVSYQLAGYGSQGISKGALVHFSEATVNEQTPATTTPWIALVACDANATDASQEVDIFTLARDKGAVAALLFSLYSSACIINPEYADPSTFDQVMDVFSTQSLTSALLIEYQFGQFGSNETKYGSYNSKLLNDSAAGINSTIASNSPVVPGYLFATLEAYNATGNSNVTNGANGSPAVTHISNSGGSPNTGLAMIILYAITGCVSALFCVVIISGAIRAIRHPERYGPRSAAQNAGDGPGQSRARGLTRAILDTFPVVKFGNTPQEDVEATAPRNIDKDIEAHPYSSDSGGDYPQTAPIEMEDWEVVDSSDKQKDGVVRPVSTASTIPGQKNIGEARHADPDAQPQASGSRDSYSADRDGRSPDADPRSSRALPPDASHVEFQLDAGPSRPTQRPVEREDVVPDSIGRETCPICIVDFEEGDDLRLLPCEGKHRFHQQCVDPWLLELSSSCPICRHDFLALETMLSGESDEDAPRSPYAHGGSPNPYANRFSRYLRFARRRRNREREREDEDPTDPYLPTASRTSM